MQAVATAEPHCEGTNSNRDRQSGTQSMTQPNDPQRRFELAAQQAREKVAREKQAQEKARQEAIAKAKADEARHQARLEMFRTLFHRYQEELIRPMLVA